MSDGLIGAIKRGSANIAGSIQNHDAWAIRLVFFAGIITILHKAGVPVTHYGVLFAVALGVAALLYEMNATTYALRAFWGGRFIGTIGWAFVWAVAFAYSMNQWVGAASESEAGKSNIHKAAFVEQVDTRAAVKRAETEVNRLEKRLALQPVRTAEAAQAAIDNAKAHKFWKSTHECKETKGPQTRQFCSDYASAVADKAGSTEMLTVAEEMKQAKARLAKAQQTAGSTKAQVSEDAPQLGFIKASLSTDDSTARQIDAMVLPFLVQAMLLFGGILLANEAFRGKPRAPWINWNTVRSVWAKLYKIVTGNDLGPGNTTVIDEGHFKAVRQSLGQAMRTA